MQTSTNNTSLFLSDKFIIAALIVDLLFGGVHLAQANADDTSTASIRKLSMAVVILNFVADALLYRISQREEDKASIKVQSIAVASFASSAVSTSLVWAALHSNNVAKECVNVALSSAALKAFVSVIAVGLVLYCGHEKTASKTTTAVAPAKNVFQNPEETKKPDAESPLKCFASYPVYGSIN